MTDEKQIIKDTFIQYSDTFAQLDPNALVRFYHQSAILIDSTRIFSVNSEEEILKILTPMIEGLKKVDYDHSETTNLSAKLLSENTAMVSGIGSRIKKNGTELGKFGFTYTLRKTETEPSKTKTEPSKTETEPKWKIIAGVIHDTDTALQLE